MVHISHIKFHTKLKFSYFCIHDYMKWKLLNLNVIDGIILSSDNCLLLKENVISRIDTFEVMVMKILLLLNTYTDMYMKCFV